MPSEIVVSRETRPIAYPEQRVVDESFPNTEIAKNNVQNILHIDPTGETAERSCRCTQFFRDQLFVPAGFCASCQSSIERRHSFFKRQAVPGARNNAGFCR
jgi:hypothetical protein